MTPLGSGGLGATTLGNGDGFAVASGLSYDATVLADTPQAFWKLDEANGSNTVADATGNGFTGTVTGTPSPGLGQASVPGTKITGTSLALAGQATGGPRFTIAPTGTLLAALQNHDFSVESWILRSSSIGVAQYNWFSAGDQATTDQQFQGQYQTTQNYIGFWSDDWSTGNNPSADAWHHLVFTFKASTKAGIFYVDGASAATHTFTGTLNVDTGNWAIGGAAGHFNCWWGNISRLAVYNYVLTPTQVSTHYQAA